MYKSCICSHFFKLLAQDGCYKPEHNKEHKLKCFFKLKTLTNYFITVLLNNNILALKFSKSSNVRESKFSMDLYYKSIICSVASQPRVEPYICRSTAGQRHFQRSGIRPCPKVYKSPCLTPERSVFLEQPQHADVQPLSPTLQSLWKSFRKFPALQPAGRPGRWWPYRRPGTRRCWPWRCRL